MVNTTGSWFEGQNKRCKKTNSEKKTNIFFKQAFHPSPVAKLGYITQLLWYIILTQYPDPIQHLGPYQIGTWYIILPLFSAIFVISFSSDFTWPNSNVFNSGCKIKITLFGPWVSLFWWLHDHHNLIFDQMCGLAGRIPDSSNAGIHTDATVEWRVGTARELPETETGAEKEKEPSTPRTTRRREDHIWPQEADTPK